MDLNEVIWRKCSRSHEDGDQCVEVASVAGIVLFRDSKDPDGPKVAMARKDFWRFAAVLKKT